MASDNYWRGTSLGLSPKDLKSPGTPSPWDDIGLEQGCPKLAGDKQVCEGFRVCF